MIEVIALGSALGSAAIAAGTALLLARRSQRPTLGRVRELEDELARERAASRRRAAEQTRASEAALLRLRRAAGLPMLEVFAGPVSGRALSVLLQERLAGLVGTDGVVVGDDAGLAWTGESSTGDAGLAAMCGAALATRFRGQLPRALHVELADARHVTIRPLPGTTPPLALAVASTSRPAPALALDAVVAWAGEVVAHPASDEAIDPLVGYASTPHAANGAASPVLAELVGEVQLGGAGTLAVGVADQLLAAHAADGPPEADLPALYAMLRALAARSEIRLGGRVRRLDWESAGGATASLVAVSSTGHSHLLAVRRRGVVDAGTFDRLAGRLRRLLPDTHPSAPSARLEERRP